MSAEASTVNRLKQQECVTTWSSFPEIKMFCVIIVKNQVDNVSLEKPSEKCIKIVE